MPVIKKTIKGDSGQDESVAMNSEPQQVVSQPKRVRKRRKVYKTVTYMDGKYMKTKDETDWESYSDNEAPPPKRVMKPMHTTAVKSESKKGKHQSSSKPVQMTLNFTGKSK
jgi:DNA polymerase delta subunit 3